MEISELPERLSPDPIAEALIEFRFAKPTVTVEGIMSAFLRQWPQYQLNRLPGADIPEDLRIMQPQLRYIAVYELRENSNLSIRISPQSVSIHMLRPYIGWDSARPHIQDVVNEIIKSIPDVKIERIGLRYINIFVDNLHGVKDLGDLSLNIDVNGQPLRRINLLFTQEISSDTHINIRVATPEHISGEVPDGAVMAIDLDVFTPSVWSSTDQLQCMQWVENAHDQEKIVFFGLVKPEIVKSWKENA